jgi:hypothetical protein
MVSDTISLASGLLKKTQTSARQGKNRGESGVYTPVHEHFEPILNAVLCRLRVFQQAASHRSAA